MQSSRVACHGKIGLDDHEPLRPDQIWMSKWSIKFNIPIIGDQCSNWGEPHWLKRYGGPCAKNRGEKRDCTEHTTGGCSFGTVVHASSVQTKTINLRILHTEVLFNLIGSG